MSTLKDFEKSLGGKERRLFSSLRTPATIQNFLNNISYCDDDFYYSPLTVLKDRKACCLDGALCAAAALRKLGSPPLIVGLIADNDDDHILALYKKRGLFGALAKSNFAGLRFREPVYRNVRELVMSYFELYFNLHGEKTLRSYTVPLNLKSFDKINWMTSDDNLEVIADKLDTIRHVPLIKPRMVQRLSPVDKRSYEAGMHGVDTTAVYIPHRNR